MNTTQNDDPRTIILLYEAGQAEALERYLHERPEEKARSLVIALSLDIEESLKERNITFSSGRDYKQPFPNLLATEEGMLSAFFSDPRWATFMYRGVALQTTFRFMFQIYLQRVWYYSNLLISIVEAHSGIQHLIVFASSSSVVFEVAGTLANREIKAVVDCTTTIAAARGITVTVIPLPLSHSSLRNAANPFFFTMRRALFGLSLAVWNAAISLLRRPRHPRLLISDHWRNVGSVIELLNGGECIFLDRTEIRHIHWRTLLRYRMRFVHSENFLSRDMRRRAREHAQALSREWSDMRSSITPIFVCRGYSLDPLLLCALDDIVSGFEKLLCEIEGTYALYESVRPDLVLLRASVSGQVHFSVLPLVAKEQGIPSLELQHGLEYLGVGSLTREHAAEYLAVYGSLVKKELLSLDYAPEKVREIGSPRFDSHRMPVATHAQQRFTVLCISPEVRPHDMYDSYSTEEYFNAVADSLKTLKNVRVIIKLRPGPANESLLRAIIARAFSGVSYVIAQYEPLLDLFAQADTMVSGNSTVILEALQCDTPTVIFAPSAIEADVVNFHFSPYREAHALFIAYSSEELTETLAELAQSSSLRDDVRRDAQAFLAQNFSFDGKSSQRFASLITELAGQSAPTTLE